MCLYKWIHGVDKGKAFQAEGTAYTKARKHKKTYCRKLGWLDPKECEQSDEAGEVDGDQNVKDFV